MAGPWLTLPTEPHLHISLSMLFNDLTQLWDDLELVPF